VSAYNGVVVAGWDGEKCENRRSSLLAGGNEQEVITGRGYSGARANYHCDDLGLALQAIQLQERTRVSAFWLAGISVAGVGAERAIPDAQRNVGKNGATFTPD